MCVWHQVRNKHVKRQENEKEGKADARSVFVGGLSLDLRQPEIKTYFEGFGEVRAVLQNPISDFNIVVCMLFCSTNVAAWLIIAFALLSCLNVIQSRYYLFEILK